MIQIDLLIITCNFYFVHYSQNMVIRLKMLNLERAVGGFFGSRRTDSHHAIIFRETLCEEKDRIACDTNMYGEIAH